jgi:hypothetical protein
MIFEEDWYGAYGTCLTCGYVYEVGAIAAQELLEQEGNGGQRQRRRQPSHGKLRL